MTVVAEQENREIGPWAGEILVFVHPTRRSNFP